MYANSHSREVDILYEESLPQEEMRSGNQRVVNTKDFTESPLDVLLRTDGMDQILEELYIFEGVIAKDPY
jgi:hypothetical protein